MASKSLNEVEKAYIEKFAGKLDAKEMAKELGRHARTVKAHIESLPRPEAPKPAKSDGLDHYKGTTSMTASASMQSDGPRAAEWQLTVAERRYVETQFQEKTPEEIAADLELDHGIVVSYIRHLTGADRKKPVASKLRGCLHTIDPSQPTS